MSVMIAQCKVRVKLWVRLWVMVDVTKYQDEHCGHCRLCKYLLNIFDIYRYLHDICKYCANIYIKAFLWLDERLKWLLTPNYTLRESNCMDTGIVLAYRKTG